MLTSLAVRYDPVEDRLILRVSGSAGTSSADHWLQITRRVCAQWRHDLQTMVDLSAQVPQQVPPPARAAVSAAHHQAMAGQATARVESMAQPAAPDAIALVTRVSCGRRRDDGRWVLTFERRALENLSLVVTSTTLHGFVAALSRSTEAAGWSLPALPFETPQTAPTPGGAFH